MDAVENLSGRQLFERQKVNIDLLQTFLRSTGFKSTVMDGRSVGRRQQGSGHKAQWMDNIKKLLHMEANEARELAVDR